MPITWRNPARIPGKHLAGMAAYLRKWWRSQRPKGPAMRPLNQAAGMVALTALALLAACSTDPARPGAPWPGLGGLFSPVSDPAAQTRRGALELLVKANHPALMADIVAGGGATLTRALDSAGVPAADRPARIIQLQSNAGLYQANPGALIAALAIYGG